MSPFGECGYRRRDSGFRRNGNSFNFAAYLFSISPLSIPAPSSSHSPPSSHSRESGNLPVYGARRAMHGLHRFLPNAVRALPAHRIGRFPLSREWKGGGREWKYGSGDGNNYFHSGESWNLNLATARIFREAEHCNCRLSANAAIAAEIPAFAGMEILLISPPISFLFPLFPFPPPPLSIPPLFPFPRKRESPCVWGKTGYARLAPIPSQCGAGVARTQNREIPAFAGMGNWGEWGIGGNENTDIIPPPSALFAAGKRKRESGRK